MAKLYLGPLAQISCALALPLGIARGSRQPPVNWRETHINEDAILGNRIRQQVRLFCHWTLQQSASHGMHEANGEGISQCTDSAALECDTSVIGRHVAFQCDTSLIGPHVADQRGSLLVGSDNPATPMRRSTALIRSTLPLQAHYKQPRNTVWRIHGTHKGFKHSFYLSPNILRSSCYRALIHIPRSCDGHSAPEPSFE